MDWVGNQLIKPTISLFAVVNQSHLAPTQVVMISIVTYATDTVAVVNMPIYNGLKNKTKQTMVYKHIENFLLQWGGLPSPSV